MFAGVAVVTFAVSSPFWLRATLSAGTLTTGYAVFELFYRRLELKEEGLTLVTNLQPRFVPRRDIQSATWAAGSGVSLKLTNGKWLHLPELGRNSLALTNTVRAWLKRTETATPPVA